MYASLYLPTCRLARTQLAPTAVLNFGITMIKYLFTILMVIGNVSHDMVGQSNMKSDDIINGNWEYKNVVINGKRVNASKLNQCGIRDILEIQSTSDVEAYQFEGEDFIGFKIGFSNATLCAIDPINYKYIVENNSCKTHWVRLSDNQKMILSISEGLAIEYEIEKLNRKTMVLSKRRGIFNYGSREPDKIVLKRVEDKN